MRFLFRRRFQNGDRTADTLDSAGPTADAELLAAWGAMRDRQSDTTAPNSPVLDRRDRRPSHRTLLAAALLRAGEDLNWVCEVTGVPVALLELIRDENTPSEFLRATPPLAKARVRYARTVIVLVVAVQLAAAATLIVYVSALLQRRAALAMLTGLLEAVLIGALWASIQLLAPRPGVVAHPPRPHPKLAIRRSAQPNASSWRRRPSSDEDRRDGNAA